MEEFMHPTETEIRMMLGTTGNKVLAVEGLTDFRFYETKIDTELVSIYDCNGRQKVIDCVKEFITSFEDRVYGVCDRDFLSLKIGSHKGKNIIHSDFHDIEIDAIEFTNFNSILNMMLSNTKLLNKGIDKTDAINKIYNFSNVIGHIRLANEMDSTLNIDFDEIKLKKGLAYDKTFNPSLNGILKCLLRPKKNNHLLPRLQEIETKTLSELSKNHDKRQTTNGHDFILITLEFINLFGVGKKSKMPDVDFLNNLILGTYDLSTFKNSKLGKKLKRLKYI